jgi:hypothetical protein
LHFNFLAKISVKVPIVKAQASKLLQNITLFFVGQKYRFDSIFLIVSSSKENSVYSSTSCIYSFKNELSAALTYSII